MFKYILKHILLTIPTTIGVSIFAFLMIHLTDLSPTQAMLGNYVSQEQIDEFHKKSGLDKSLFAQYIIFIKKSLQGDFSISLVSQDNVFDEFKKHFIITFELASIAMFIAIVLGVSIGIIAALYKDSIFDYIVYNITLTGVSMPIFWLALLSIYIFSVELNLLPISGRLGFEFYIEEISGLHLVDSLLVDDYKAFFNALKHLFLPSLVLSFVSMSIIARTTRTSMIIVLKKDYMITANIKGTSKFSVIIVHALRNALTPILKSFALSIGPLFAGIVLIETTFAWPGLGHWLVNAIEQNDFPVIRASVLLISILFILINLFIDIFLAIINPKIRLKNV